VGSTEPTISPMYPDISRAPYLRFTCVECGVEQAGTRFIGLFTPEKYERVLAKTTNLTSEDLALRERLQDGRPFNRRCILPERPCKSCRARAASRRSQEKARAKAAKDLEDQRMEYIAQGKELPPMLQPKVRLPKTTNGVDPVLDVCTRLIANYKDRLKFVTQRYERQSASINQPKALKWQQRLYEARIMVFEEVRAQRRLDLQNPVEASDPTKLHWRAYITPYQTLILDDIAAKANKYRQTYGRPYVGLPERIRPLLATDTANARTMEAAWAPIRAAAAYTLKLSRAAIRSKYRNMAARKVPVYHADPAEGVSHWLTLEEFHTRRAEAAEYAIREIDACAKRREVHPTDWTSPYTGQKEPVSKWAQLVPPLMCNELMAMEKAIDNKTVQAFPNATPDRRNRFQKAQALDTLNRPLPKPAIATPDAPYNAKKQPTLRAPEPGAAATTATEQAERIESLLRKVRRATKDQKLNKHEQVLFLEAWERRTGDYDTYMAALKQVSLDGTVTREDI
jgi:hypothetical protein